MRSQNTQTVQPDDPEVLEIANGLVKYVNYPEDEALSAAVETVTESRKPSPRKPQ